MENFQDFNLIQSGELTAVRHGLFNPTFEITDGQMNYGQVITKKTSSTDRGAFETSKERWVLKREDKIITLSNSRSENIGLLEDNGRILQLNNGFEATISVHGGGRSAVLSSWKNKQGNELVNFKQSAYSYRRPYTITFDPALLKTVLEIPLLVLLGIHLSFLKQTRRYI